MSARTHGFDAGFDAERAPKEWGPQPDGSGLRTCWTSTGICNPRRNTRDRLVHIPKLIILYIFYYLASHSLPRSDWPSTSLSNTAPFLPPKAISDLPTEMKWLGRNQSQKPPVGLAFRSSKTLILTSICVAIFTVRGPTYSVASASRHLEIWLTSVFRICFYMESSCL